MDNTSNVGTSKGIPPQKHPGVPIALAFVLFVLAGAPLAYFSWKTLSDLLAGRVEGRSLLIGAGSLVVLFLLLRGLGSYLKRL